MNTETTGDHPGVFCKETGESFGSRPKALWKVQLPYQSAVGEGGLISELPLESRTLGGLRFLLQGFCKKSARVYEGSSTTRRVVEGSNTKRIRRTGRRFFLRPPFLPLVSREWRNGNYYKYHYYHSSITY